LFLFYILFGLLYTNVFYHSVSITNVYFECHTMDILIVNLVFTLFFNDSSLSFKSMSEFNKSLAIFYKKNLTIIFIFTTIFYVEEMYAQLLSSDFFNDSFQ